MQLCSICQQTKQFTEFARNRTKKSGYQSTCKPCKRTYDKKRISTIQPVTHPLVCTRCHEELPHDQFYVNKYTASGRSTICTPCIKNSKDPK